MISGGAGNGDQVWPRVTHNSDPSDPDPWETWIRKTRICLSQVCTGFPRVTCTGYPRVLGLVDSFARDWASRFRDEVQTLLVNKMIKMEDLMGMFQC